MVVVWGVRWAEHAHALALLEQTQVATAQVKRMAAEPYPVNPFRWHAILETAHYWQTAEVNTRTGEIDSDPQTDVIYMPPETPATEAAKRTPLGGCIWIGGRGPWCGMWARCRWPGWTRHDRRVTANGRPWSLRICGLTTPIWAREGRPGSPC